MKIRIFLSTFLLFVILFPYSDYHQNYQFSKSKLANIKNDSSITYTAVSAGEAHSCALTSTGGVKCWGDNWAGKLGDGTFEVRSTPEDVVGLTSGVSSIAAGGEHTCALTTGGGVKCWGGNYAGQLGDNTTDYSPIPVNVVGLESGVAAIAAGFDHTCALTSGGGVKCWGNNEYGQLGDDTNDNRLTPVGVFGLSDGVTDIIAGYQHSCGLTSGGGVKCWGSRLPIGSSSDRNKPVDVSGLTSGVQAIAGGYKHSCALTSGGGVKCWGGNEYGQLGNDSTEQSLDPVNVFGLSSGVIAVAAGGLSSCALTSEDQVKCWGANMSGALGDGSTTSSDIPVSVSGLINGVSTISVGSGHSCAISSSGTLQCWGGNDTGQSGDGRLMWTSLPLDVSGLSSGNTMVATGSRHSCVVTSAGGVKCWGDNFDGQLGDGTSNDRSEPVDVVGLTGGVIAVQAGFNHTCALISGGKVKCWGNNDYGHLGNGTQDPHLTPQDVNGLAQGVLMISTQRSHNCALTDTGLVKCWGSNSQGQLGDGTTTDRSEPVDVTGLSSNTNSVAAGGRHTCALSDSGGVKCWGDNYYGQLGDNNNNDSSTPVDVVGLSSGVTHISLGRYHTCVVVTGGGVKCWGKNEFGQLGDGSTSDVNSPVDVVGLSNGVSTIIAGEDHTCALMTGGGMKCWGYNYYGQLGDGTDDDRYTPVDVVGVSGGGLMGAAGGISTCALVNGGRLKCWGSDKWGLIGQGSNLMHLTPNVVIDSLPAQIKLNYKDGSPGSYFTLNAANFPPSTSVTISVNGSVLTDSMMTTESGGALVFLSIAGANEGFYQVSASGYPSARVVFKVSSNSLQRSLEGGGQILVVPPGIGFNDRILIPLISRN